MRTALNIGLIVLLMGLFFGCAGKEPQLETVAPVPPPQVAEPEPAGAETAPKPQYRPVATVTAAQLNIHRQSTPESEVVSVLRRGDQLEVVSGSDDWLEVLTPEGKTGWINSFNVQVVDEAEGRPLDDSDLVMPVLAPSPESAIVEEALETTTPEHVRKSPPEMVRKPPEVLRKELEMVWDDYRRAHAFGDMALLKQTSSDYSYGTMVNALASAGKTLNPEALTFSYELMPDVASLNFVELTKKGPTAGLLYMGEGGDGSEPGQPPQPGFLFIKFVQQHRGWTVGGMQSTPATELQQTSGQVRFDPASLPGDLVIDGLVRPAPEAVKLQ